MLSFDQQLSGFPDQYFTTNEYTHEKTQQQNFLYILNLYNGIDVFLPSRGRFGIIYCEGGAPDRTLHQKHTKNYLKKPKYSLKQFNNIKF